MLTALDSDMNQILGLELGANDYILKTTPPRYCWPVCASSYGNGRRPTVRQSQSTAQSTPAELWRVAYRPLCRDVRLANQVISFIDRRL